MPAPFISIANCIAVRINAHYLTYPNVMNHVLHFRSPTTDPPAAECAVVAAFVNSWCAADYADCISLNWTIDSVEAFSAYRQDGGYAIVTTPCTGSTSNTLQPDAAPLVLIKTGLRGRSHTGRFYALSPQTEEISAQSFSGTLRTALVAAFQALAATADTAGYPLVVASPTLQLVTDAAGFTTSPRLTKQTRRRLGFGG